jgi:hypothetical protein
MTKKYITPLAKEPEFIVVPSGSLDERGNKLKRKAIKFNRNNQGVGQYITSDPAEQKFLENCEWFRLGKLHVVTMKEVEKEPETPVSPAQAVGPQTSEVKTKPEGKKAKAKA